MKTELFFAKWVLFPLLAIVFPLCGLFAWREFSLPMPIIVGILVLAGEILILYFERRVPYHSKWNLDHNDTRTDIIHAIVNTVIGITAQIGIIYFAHKYCNSGLARNFFGDHGLFIDFGIYFLFVEYLQYAYHRWMHEHGGAWLFHEIHHCSKRLYSLNSMKMHPCEALIKFSLPGIAFMIVGASTESMILYSVHTALMGLLQHANVDMNCRFWRLIFSTPDLHRIHHLKENPVNNLHNN